MATDKVSLNDVSDGMPEGAADQVRVTEQHPTHAHACMRAT